MAKIVNVHGREVLDSVVIRLLKSKFYSTMEPREELLSLAVLPLAKAKLLNSEMEIRQDMAEREPYWLLKTSTPRLLLPLSV